MAAEKNDMFTAGKIAQQLGASPAQVKQAIQTLKLKPAAKKGACTYYGKDAVAKIKGAIR